MRRQCRYAPGIDDFACYLYLPRVQGLAKCDARRCRDAGRIAHEASGVPETQFGPSEEQRTLKFDTHGFEKE